MQHPPFAQCFQELRVYQQARKLAQKIFSHTQTFPTEERYSLTNQIRRASRSIGAQIAEAWGKRSYERHFVSKLTDADSEQKETQHWLIIAADCGYTTAEQTRTLTSLCEEIGRMLAGMIAKRSQFCGSYNYSVEEFRDIYPSFPDDKIGVHTAELNPESPSAAP